MLQLCLRKEGLKIAHGCETQFFLRIGGVEGIGEEGQWPCEMQDEGVSKNCSPGELPLPRNCNSGVGILGMRLWEGLG